MSLTPPDPSTIRANLSNKNAHYNFSAAEFAKWNDPAYMQRAMKITPAQMGDAEAIVAGGPGMTPIQSPMKAIPDSLTRHDFYETILIYADDEAPFSSSSQARYWMEEDQPQYFPPQGPAYGWSYQNLAGTPMDYQGPAGIDGAPAAITEIPTSTTNPDKPRTVAAGYDVRRQCLTVVFRDGTYYNYYQVPVGVWNNFKSAYSKGVFIRAHLDHHPRGKADVSQLPDYAREALYRVVRTGQIKREGLTGTQTANARRRQVQKYAKGNLGGTGRARMKKASGN